jgi:phosphocarrier protein HPr
MATAKATIKNINGIHCRPSAVIIGQSKKYSGSIKISSINGETDLKSVIGLIGLGLEIGHEITIDVSGEDEDTFAQKLIDLFETEFDFPERE